jgi:hypothetical protein
MDWKRIAASGAIVAAFAALPLSGAEARCWRGNPFCWPFIAGAAVVGTAAAVATAPLRAVAHPYYYRPYAGYPYGYYPPAPAYYAPRYYGPAPYGSGY